MESMKKYKTYEAWAAKHVRKGDLERFRDEWDKLHEPPRRRRRTKAEMQAANENAD